MTDLDLYLEDHHHMLRDMVRECAEAEIAPGAAQVDEAEEFPWESGKIRNFSPPSRLYIVERGSVRLLTGQSCTC